MKAVKVRVENGEIRGRAPAGFPEGEIDVCLAEPDEPMSPEEQAALDAGWRCIEEGRFRPAQYFLAELRGKV